MGIPSFVFWMIFMVMDGGLTYHAKDIWDIGKDMNNRERFVFSVIFIFVLTLTFLGFVPSVLIGLVFKVLKVLWKYVEIWMDGGNG